MRQPGRHLLQIPGPTNLPDAVLRAMSQPLIDHRSPQFATLTKRLIAGLREVIGTDGPIALYPSSGTGAWEAACVNTLNPGEAVLVCENGFFASQWGALAERLGLIVHRLSGDWRKPPDPKQIAERLAEDEDCLIKAVLVVHNETSTGVAANIPSIRAAIDSCSHPSLLLVDTISSLASTEYCHDLWGVDVTIAGSQKGLMLPPGLGINAMSEQALKAMEKTHAHRSYWDWRPLLETNNTGLFPYTPAVSLFFALDVALSLLQSEGLSNVITRHQRHAAATRAAVLAWGLEVYCRDEDAHSTSLTAVLCHDNDDTAKVIAIARETFGLSLGTGLDRLAGRVFRIGHLGDFNDLMLAGTLSGVELTLAAAGIDFQPGGIQIALDVLATEQQVSPVRPETELDGRRSVIA